MIFLDACRGLNHIGRLGENEHRVILFRESAEVLAMYPEASVTVLHRRPGDPAAYPVAPGYVSIEGGIVHWKIQSGDLERVGRGRAEVVFTQGDVIAKSLIYDTMIDQALDGSGDPPEPWESWQESLVQTAQGAYDAAEDAKKWATGLDKDGNPVPSTDTHYENNAYYYMLLCLALSGKYPKVENGYWYVWDAQNEQWTSTGVKATGADGVSPTVSTTSITGGTRVTITDGTGDHTFDVMNGTNGEDGDDGVSPTIAITDITGGHRVTITDATGDHSFDVMDGTGGGVQDVQVNGASVVTNGVANVPIASSNNNGVVAINVGWGIGIDGSTQKLYIASAPLADIKTGTQKYKPITTSNQHQSAFYALAKAAGDSTQSESNNSVGTYTEDALSKISDMLNAPVSVSGSTPTINAKSGIRYICGEVATLDIVVPASSCIDVTFESGSTATVLTITPPTGQTVSWANGFDPTALEANTVYELNICDLRGVAGSWT